MSQTATSAPSTSAPSISASSPTAAKPSAPLPSAPWSSAPLTVQAVQLANDSVIHLLNPGQCAALASLSDGETIRQAADAAGVDRHTVTRWIKLDPLFRAAYNAWRQELIESTRARLLRTAEAAAGAVNAAVVKGDARIAMSLLSKLGMAIPAASETADPALLRERIAAERELEEHLLIEAQKASSLTRFDREDLRIKLQEQATKTR